MEQIKVRLYKNGVTAKSNNKRIVIQKDKLNEEDVFYIEFVRLIDKDEKVPKSHNQFAVKDKLFVTQLYLTEDTLYRLKEAVEAMIFHDEIIQKYTKKNDI